jgi:aspartate aminotransferase
MTVFLDPAQVSERAKNIQPSPTLAIDAKAKKMRAEGQDVVGFGAGEPDFDTPEFIKQAAVEALKAGFTKYTPSSGTEDLRQAIADKFKQDNGLDYTFKQVVVSNGAKHSIANVAMAVLNPGDEVIIPAPYWVSYPEIVKLAGGVPVILPTREEDHFRVRPEDLAKAITPRTRLFILCSPSNPTGSVYTRAELEALATVLEKQSVLVLSDEIYEKLVYGGAKHVSIGSLSKAMLERTLTVNGMSKAYSMTGWRIGYCAGPQKIMDAINNLQSHGASNPVSISQKASLAALKGPQDEIEKMRQEFDRRRQAIVKLLNAIPGVQCQSPDGAFYAFPNISKLFGKSMAGRRINGSTDFATVLLEEAKVAVVPGADFGADAYIRLSYATSMANIEKGVGRIAEFASKLQ